MQTQPKCSPTAFAFLLICVLSPFLAAQTEAGYVAPSSQACEARSNDTSARLLECIQQKALWGTQEFYRAYSSVTGGRKLETDLFQGLR